MGVFHAIADAILILAAFFALLAFGFLAYSGFYIYRMVKEVRGEINELTVAGRETVAEVQATGRYVSGSIVKPASVMFGYATAVRATLKALTENVQRKSRP